MYIKRQCLTAVGNFDEKNFGLGYGEECDFSMRAHRKGWKNVIAADVFVFHEGAVSFSTQSEERKERADLIMQNLHPDYDELVTQFVLDDPLLPFRRNVDHLRLAQKPGDGTNIYEESIEPQLTLRKRAVEEREARKAQELILRESLEKSVWLEKELGTYFELASWQKQELARHIELDSWQKQELIRLADIERHNKVEIESLNNLLKQSRAEFSRTDAALAEAQQLVAQLNDNIGQIKQTRSWRYTAWFRKLEGSL